MKWIQKLNDLPKGYTTLLYKGKKYGVIRTDFNDGKSIKVYAEELGGNHFISFNYYKTTQTSVLKPCEMPEEAVIHFLENYKIIPTPLK